MSDQVQALWTPSPERAAATRMAAFMQATGHADYRSLWQWSVDQSEDFWCRFWDCAGVIGDRGQRVLEDGDRMPGARWFPDACLNYAENVLHQRGDGDALVFWGESKVKARLSHDQLRDAVARFQQVLLAAGVQPGDRVAGLLPNLPETVIAYLATAGLGAIWSSASPDFGVQGVLDRFGQIEPKVFIGVDGYWYNGKPVDCLAKNAEILAQLPSVQRALLVPYLGIGEAPAGFTPWPETLAAQAGG
ncbi:MAG TPA: AMP-binding protein, partial [Rhodocyclaceae bacterium]|nr:AMP-binding protein [Rhodocyclaceae bacterium]